MRTIVVGPWPAELEALIERRRATGADRYDEVWDGDYHMAPAPRKRHALLGHRLATVLAPLAERAGLYGSAGFNLGETDNYRIPDGGLHRDESDELYVTTAALVIEILSPEDETWEKLPFYAEHDVDEVLIVDPDTRTVPWLERDGTTYRPTEHSTLLDIGVSDLAGQIRWPPAD
jgi:Uma2 family endonuclease